MPWDKLTLITKTLPWYLPFLIRGTLQRLSAIWHKHTYAETPNAQTIVVIGGSFAGLQTVRRLTETLPTGYKVIWIERNSHLNYVFAFPRFSVLPGFEQRAFIPYDGVEQAAPRGLLKRIQGRVVSIEDGAVRLESGERVEYNYLVIATGSTRSVPGQLVATERADACDELRAVQALIKDSRKIAVVGAGAVGVELAADIRDFYPESEVTLVHSRGQVLNRFGKRLQEFALKTLQDELKVRVLLNERPVLPSGGAIATSASLKFSDGSEEGFDLVIRCTGQTPNSSIISSLHPGAISESTSQILVKPTLQIFTPDCDKESDQRIFALGDVAAHPGPLMARAGFMQAETVVSNLLSLVKGQEPKTIYKPTWFIEGAIKLTLGRAKHVIYMSDVDGTEVLVSSGGGSLDMDVGHAWKQFGGLAEKDEEKKKSD
ncbi:hypothetical protein BJX76DRAFT_368320 [Aspergillus varians]